MNFLISGVLVENQLIPISESVLSIPGRKSEAVKDLVFKATDLPPLGFKSFYLKTLNSEQAGKRNHENTQKYTYVSISNFIRTFQKFHERNPLDIVWIESIRNEKSLFFNGHWKYILQMCLKNCLSYNYGCVEYSKRVFRAPSRRKKGS